MENLAILEEYDIRGIYGKDLREENVVRIGYLVGQELDRKGGKTLGVGYYVRLHSQRFLSGFAREY